MAIQPNLPNPSFADASAYDSDDEGINASASVASSSGSTGSTGVVLGFDDGAIEVKDENSDEADLTVSRIGGRPYFPLQATELPPTSLLDCPICSASLRLLTQIYAPLNDEKLRSLSKPYSRNSYRDEFDRLLYVFGCVKKGCLGVRLLRAAKRNHGYAKAGREKRKLLAVDRARQEKEKAQKRSTNPFASTSTSVNPFAASNASASVDFGSMIFGSEQPTQPEYSKTVETAPEPADSASDLSTSKATNTGVLWSSESKPFTAHYLTTSSEYLSPSFASKGKQGQLVKKLAEMSMSQEGASEPKEQHKGGRIAKTGSKAGSESSSAGDGWSAEAYEVMRLSGVEEVFLAFQERLEASDAQEQVIRYDFKGTPLPFQAKSKPYQLLFSKSAAPGGLTTVTRTAHATPAASQDIRRYDETCSEVERCMHCQSPRTFEMQLMPNVVNILEAQLDGKAGEELGWATVWCFTCSADCLDASNDGPDEDGLDWQGWREEVAMVELED